MQAMSAACRTVSLLMVTVASATLRATGVQSSLLEELIKLSIAPFRMSMPEAEAQKKQNISKMGDEVVQGLVL